MFLIEFNDTDNIENTNNTSDLTLWVNRYQVDLFADQAIKICASGRPLCNLCGVPVDSPEEGGHLCPRRNGNHPIDEIQKI
jgi:5-methylcytosine-specific restriction endonuclease McrA